MLCMLCRNNNENDNYNSYLCIKGIIRRLWHEGMFKARGTRAFKFPRAIIDNYASGTVTAVEISDRKDLNTLYLFRNLISVNRIFIKDYKVSVSI
jgi:hypothetical protein